VKRDFKRFPLGDYTITVTPSARRPGAPGRAGATSQPEPEPSGIFIATGPDEYFIVGSGFSATFSPNTPGPPIAGLARVEEGRFVNGEWKHGLTRAGDSTGQGNQVQLRGGQPSIQRVVVYRYE
jgi:hypothetical protein